MKTFVKRIVSLLAVIILLFTTIPAVCAGVDPVSRLTFSPCAGYTRVIDATYPCEGDLVIPAYHNNWPVTQIGTGALNYTNITSVVIPDTVTSFAGGYNFDGCRQMKTATLSDNLAIIPNNAFANCDVLESVDLGTGVTAIYCYAFYGCPKLKYVSLPLSIKEIRNSAFNTYDLQCIYYPGTIAEWKQVDVEDYAVSEHVLYQSEIKSTVSTDSGVKITAAERPGATSYTFYRGEKKNGTWSSWSAIKKTSSATYTDTTAVVGRTYRYAVKASGGPYTTKLSNAGKEVTFTKVSSVKLSKTSYTYDGTVKTPSVTVKDSTGKTLKKDTDYTVTYASGRKNVGTYKVTVKMKGKYSGTKTLSFKINPIQSSTCSFKLSATSYTYNGAAKKPTVTVKNKNGTKLTNGTHYTVTYATGRKNVGTYKVTVKMKGNYSGTKTLTFKINPVSVSKCKLSLSTTAYTYDGKVKKPTVTVKTASGTKLTTSSYTVTYASGRKNVGTYKVTVKMKGNYTGSKTLTFKINPAKTTVSKVTPATKSLKVAITKKSTQVTGYQVQYSTSKNFTSPKTKTITSYKTTSTTISSLKAKTTYYVRVRTYKTVGSTKYYSAWSAAKSVKVK